jgi:hypothetical protein
MTRIFRGLRIGKSKVKRIINLKQKFIIILKRKIRKGLKGGDSTPQDIVIKRKLILLKLSELLYKYSRYRRYS